MKRLFFLLFVLSTVLFADAQYHNPETCSGTVVCPVCFGTRGYYGYFGFTPCMNCGGRGVTSCGLCAAYRAGYESMKKRLEEQKSQNNGSYTSPSGGVYVVPGGSYGSSSGDRSSSSSTYTQCRTCGGSGVCTSCHGSGGEWRDTGYYTGSGSKSWINCPSCNGNKRCFNCHGTGRY